MARSNDLTGILTALTQADAGEFGYRQGFVQEWNAGNGTNAIVVAGATIFNVPFLMRTEALAIRPGDVVGLLRVRSQYFVLGRISVNAGEILVLDPDGETAAFITRGPGGFGGIIGLRGAGSQVAFTTATLGGEIAGRLAPFVSGDNRAAVLLAPPRTVGTEESGPRLLLEGRTAANADGGASLRSPNGQVVIEASPNATAFVLGGAAVLEATNTDAIVRADTGTARLEAEGVQVTSDTDVLVNAGNQMWVDTAGQIVLDSAAGQTFIMHTTTSAGANTVISTGGLIQRSTSSRRYKTNIADLAVAPADALKLRPRTWRDRAEVDADPDTDRWHVGFIAEEVDEAGLGAFVDYDTEGRPDAVAYDRLAVALLELARHQEARVARLEAALGLAPLPSPGPTSQLPQRRPAPGQDPASPPTTTTEGQPS